MKLGQYEALNSKELRNTFMGYVDALNMPAIDYVAIGIQDTIQKKSASLMSRVEWQNTFKSLNLSKEDPVRITAFTNKSGIFSFDEVDCRSSAGKEVMRQRKLHEIENGLVLIKRNLGTNFMLTLATGYKDFDAYKFFISHRMAINHVFDDLISIVSPETKEYQFTKLTHQTVYAK